MRYREIAPFQTAEAVQPALQQQTTKTVPQQRPVYPVQPDQVRSAIVQRKLAFDIAQSANQVEPTELEKVKAFTRYAEVQKQANANAAQAQKAVTVPKQIDSRRTRR
jgi:hypothetical protein